MERTVIVHEKPFKVTVDRLSKTVWRASGEYLGEDIEAEGNSEGAALSAWRTIATRAGS